VYLVPSEASATCCTANFAVVLCAVAMVTYCSLAILVSWHSKADSVSSLLTVSLLTVSVHQLAVSV